MRPFIIVTVKGEQNMNYDLELPTNVPVGYLIRDIVELINEYKRPQWLKGTNYSLRCERLSAALPKEKTLGEIGVWTGDVLLLQ